MPTVISAKEFAVQLAKVSRPSLRALSPRILDPLASLTGKTPQLHSNHATAAQPRRIGIAVSGGVDSMALVTLLARHYRSSIESAVQLHGFIVDHKLRDESTIESQFVAKEIAKQGVTPHILTLDWSVYSNQQKISSHQANAPEQQQQQQDHKPEKHHLETQARLERYRAIAQQCHALQIQELFVGHHSGDQVETVLFRLSRASGIDGLSGIQSMAPFGVLNVPEALDLDVVRPLLDFDKLQRMSSPASLSLPPVKSSADQGDSIQPASAGSPELVAWLKESESHVATRLVSFLVQWVNCRDHPPGREETQSMLEQMWLQNEVDLNKVVLDSGRGKKDDAEE
ncbi:hypothetical protein BGZ83_005465 [Gryganskiella cystojenkinii]|nr:hypothetical protein BGZ83_005465 [Gryganskiella cystojenkinii]